MHFSHDTPSKKSFFRIATSSTILQKLLKRKLENKNLFEWPFSLYPGFNFIFLSKAQFTFDDVKYPPQHGKVVGIAIYKNMATFQNAQSHSEQSHHPTWEKIVKHTRVLPKQHYPLVRVSVLSISGHSIPPPIIKSIIRIGTRGHAALTSKISHGQPVHHFAQQH